MSVGCDLLLLCSSIQSRELSHVIRKNIEDSNSIGVLCASSPHDMALLVGVAVSNYGRVGMVDAPGGGNSHVFLHRYFRDWVGD